MTVSDLSQSARASFFATHWSLVLRARGESEAGRAALSELCAAYYAPTHAFVRVAVHDEDKARDLTQEFFARVLKGGAFDGAAPEHGRFRSYLLGAVKHFLSDARDREGAGKRGGGVEWIPIEPGTETSPGFDAPNRDAVPSDLVFDRQWALTLLERALRRLEADLAGAGKASQFEVLKPWLTGAASLPQSEAAKRLGLSENAVKVAIHRLRTRFRESLSAEIAQTVAGPEQVDEELNYLIEVLASVERA
jgi:RNA polymerase sigma-70 factor (ECF subfamily)